MEKIAMSAEELREFEEFKKAKAEKERLAKQKNDRETYKKLVDEAIDAVFPSGQALAMLFGATKKRIYDSFKNAIDLKADVFGVKDGQQSHTWTHSNGKLRVILGYSMRDDYDDTVSAGIEKVKQYISSLADSEKTQTLVNAIFRLLAKDKTSGTLKASRVIQLRKMAEDSGNAEFMDGVHIIEAAYRPVPTSLYVKMYYRGVLNEWVSVPLGMTEAKESEIDMKSYDNLMELINRDLSGFILPKRGSKMESGELKVESDRKEGEK